MMLRQVPARVQLMQLFRQLVHDLVEADKRECSRRYERTVTLPTAASVGDQPAGADAQPSAPEAATGGEDGAADAGEASLAVEEEIDLDDYQLTVAEQDAMAKEDWTWTERPGRRPTREEKGSYIDNADLENEVGDCSYASAQQLGFAPVSEPLPPRAFGGCVCASRRLLVAHAQCIGNTSACLS